MTIVLAYPFLREIGIIADCRVSYPFPQEPDDCLQKLYQIHNRLVIGFAGPLNGAFKVLEHVRINALKYPRRLSALKLQADVERWIRYAYKELNQADRLNLSFLLAAIEPRREKPSKWYHDGVEIPKPRWFPYVPDSRIVALKPSNQNPSDLVKEEKGMKIIGIAQESSAEIERQANRLFGFSLNQPQLRMQALMFYLKYHLTSRQFNTVGGLLQSALLGERGIIWVGYAGPTVILEEHHGRFVQRDTVSGRTLPLMTIWEWAALKPSPGSLGTFDDPGLQKALNELRQTQAVDGKKPR